MRNDVLKVVGALFVTLTGVIGVLAIAHIIMSLPFGKDGAEWVSAFGTVGALIGAIWIASWQSREKRKEEILVARVSSFSLVVKLDRALEKVNESKKMLDESLAADTGPAAIAQIASMLAEVKMNPTDGLVIAPLSPATSGKLAEALQLVLHTEEAIRKDFLNGSLNTIEERTKHSREYRANVVRASESIAAALELCRTARVALMGYNEARIEMIEPDDVAGPGMH